MPVVVHSFTSTALDEKNSNSNSSYKEYSLQVRKLILLISDSQVVLALINFFFSFLFEFRLCIRKEIMLKAYGISNRIVVEHICIAELALASQAKAAVGFELILQLSDLFLEFVDVLSMQIPGSLCCLSVLLLLQLHPLLLAELQLIVLATILLLFYCFPLVLAVLIGREGLRLVTVEGQGLPL